MRIRFTRTAAQPFIALPALAALFIGLGASRATTASSTADSRGSVTGAVKFLETPPKPERLKVDTNPKTCGVSKLSEDFIVSPKTKGLKNVVLTVVGVPATSDAASKQEPVLGQQKCLYEPHVQTAVVGQKLQIVNHDDVLHNIHAYAPNKDTLFNIAQPLQNMIIPVKLDREGIVTVKCDVHSWMRAYVVVGANPYTAVTDEDGAFKIDGVPAGSYKLRAWHEALGELTKDVTIVAARDTPVTFDVGK